MSYEIIYDKQFIKLERKNEPTQFIPMIYAGSNNCSEYYYDARGRHRERRERNWFNFTHLNNGKPWGTQEAMLKKMEEERAGYIQRQNERDDDKYEDRRFGYFASLSISGSTHNTSFQDYTGIVRNGCKNALTIEELAKYNIGFKLFTGSDYYSKEKFEKAGIEPFTMYPKTTEEFFEMYEEFKAKTEPFGIPCYFQLEADQDTLKRLRKTLNPKQKVREVIEVDKWWTVEIGGLGTFVKFTRTGTLYSAYSTTSGKKLISKAEANKCLKKVKERLGYKYPDIKLKEHNTPTRVVRTKYVKKKDLQEA